MAPSPQSAKTYVARHRARALPIVSDKVTRDPAWDSAQLLTEFSFPWSDRTPPRTEFRALCDELGLVFRFDVTDADLVVGDGADAKEIVIASDRAEIFFSTGPELKCYYGLEIAPNGVVLSYQASFHRQMNWDWSCEGLQTATAQTPDGYVVQGRVPRSTLVELGCLHRDDGGEYLIAGLFRAEFSHDPAGGPVIEEWLSWVNPQVPTPDFHVPTAFGTIRWGQ